MRTQKLHNAGAVASVLNHHLRLRETPNAEVEEITENWYDKVDYQDPLNRQENNDIEQREKAKARAMEQFREELPDKLRKNGVQAVELMMTASPEAMADPNFDKVQYLNDCDKWAKDTFGKENVFFIAHHFDETTPHSSVMLLPKDENGKLNCRKFLGGRKKMRELQDSFYEQVGKKYNLDRGVKKSKAKHKDVKKFYGAVQDTKKEAYDISTQIAQSLPERRLIEGNSAYMEKVKAQIAHDLTPIVAKHLNAPSEKQRTRELNRTLARTIEQTTEETRQSVTEEVTQQLTDKYDNDLEQAVKERTRQQAEELAKARAQIVEMRKAREKKEAEEKKAKAEREKAERERQEKERKAEEERKEQEEERERQHQAEIDGYKEVLYKDATIKLKDEAVSRDYKGIDFVDEDMNTVHIQGGIAYPARVAYEVIQKKSPDWFYDVACLMRATQQTNLANAIIVKDRPYPLIEPGDVFSPAVIRLHQDKAGLWVTITDKTDGTIKTALPGLSQAIMESFEPESRRAGSKYEVNSWSLDETGLINYDLTEENLAQDEKPRKENEPRVLELKLDIKEEKKKQLELEKKNKLHL